MIYRLPGEKVQRGSRHEEKKTKIPSASLEKEIFIIVRNEVTKRVKRKSNIAA